MVRPLQICTFKWGNRYTVEHVIRLRNMLARNLTIPWEFVLITDNLDADSAGPDDGAGVDDGVRFPPIRLLPLWDDLREAKLCGVRLRAFGSDMAERIGPRFAWIDLDVVITGNVDHIFGRTEPFVSLQPPRPPMPINGSLVMMDAGAFPEVFEKWTAARYKLAGEELTRRYGVPAGTESDEGWMWYALGATYGSKQIWPIGMPVDTDNVKERGILSRDDGVYYFRRDLESGRKPLPPDARLVVMNGRAFDPSLPKWQARAPWIRSHWK
jgi:hypothetical protein